MKLQTKQRMKLTIILFICILVIGLPIYTIWGPKVDTGMIGSVYVVDVNDKERIKIIKNQDSPYGFKIQDNSKFYLQTYKFGLPSYNDVGKYILTKEQYDNLEIGKLYWLDIKYYKPYDRKTGIIKKCYTYNPAQ